MCISMKPLYRKLMLRNVGAYLERPFCSIVFMSIDASVSIQRGKAMLFSNPRINFRNVRSEAEIQEKRNTEQNKQEEQLRNATEEIPRARALSTGFSPVHFQLKGRKDFPGCCAPFLFLKHAAVFISVLIPLYFQPLNLL